MASSASTAPHNPEYQHFVPQFMLRNFAHKYTGPQRTKNGNNKGKNKEKKKNGTLYRGELVVNNVNLRADPIVIEETKVSRILGQYDMYQDTAQPTGQQRQIEAMFSRLESHVSIIFRKIVKAFEGGEPNVWVTREERNSIRKFLFILKYRGSTFRRRFHHQSSDEYDANDKSQLQKYMDDNGFTRPIDVWFHGLRTIVNLKMDRENWKQELVESMYREDAMWFIMHSEGMYMAFCTPSEPGTEFILTDNSYNVFEGPNHFVQDPATGELKEAGWTSFHEFAPLSPKIMIVLRSFLLPVPEEDSDPNIRAEREAFRKGAIDDWYGESLQSNLADLPIRKPRNNYSEVVNGHVRLLPGEDGVQHKKQHKFCFSFFQIETEHVNKINMFLFDNAHRCTNIVLGSKDAFLKTLEWYMTRSTLGKSVVGDSQDERRKLLMNLAALLKSLGSTLEPVWTEGTAHAMPESDKVNAFQWLLRTFLTDWLFSSKKEQQESLPPPQGPKTAYITLAGSFESLPEDMAHSQRMLKKRIKIDVESQGRPEAIRAQARERLIEEYLTYPPRTLYLFSKRVRMMILGQENEGYLHSATASALPQPKDPEDIIAQALHNKMVPEKLNRLLYKTTMNDIDRTNYPISENELWKTPTPSLEGALRLQMIRKFVFDLPGLLKECGIAEIERLALSQELKVRQQNLNNIKGLPYPFIDDDQKIELLTRVMAKPRFREALEGKVEATMLDKLEDVIFKTSYPSPPIKPPI